MGVIVGTAGHIDHGKSQLVKYLTGTDPDRLKEEKERGITIELGYVFMPLPDGSLLSFIDVPGHENFVRQMVAGTATVDCFLLVVAADEGIMPQTREHLDILRLLGVEKGMVAITKCDLVDSEMQELVEMEIQDLFHGTVFEGTPVYRVSSISGIGMDRLREGLVRTAMDMGQRQSGNRFRLDVDRVFVLEGFGTIVAGTAISGSVSPGQEVELQPGGGRYRVREIRVNTRKDVPTGFAGDRIAMNLVGLDKDDAHRGACVAEPGYMQVRESLDTSLTMVESAEPLKRYQRVRFHTGTAEVMARAIPVEGNVIAPGTTGYAHFQLESPVAAMPGDRFVIRSYSPVITIGGGRILETGTRKVRRKYRDERVSHLEVLEAGDLKEILSEMVADGGTEGITAGSAASGTSRPVDEVLGALSEMADDGTVNLIGTGPSTRAVDGGVFRDACRRLTDRIVQHHRENPLSPGVQLSEPSRILGSHPQWLVRSVLDHLLSSGVVDRRRERLALSEHPEGIPKEFRPLVEKVLSEIDSAGEKGMPAEGLPDRSIVRALLDRDILSELAEGVLVTGSMAEKTMERVRGEYGENGFTLAELRDFLGVSRKDALRWAELFDGRGWTTRREDRRFFRRT
ncbi:MAG: selenocysteine-specific translation elongation factor [Candidatus Fermentibacteraceae bacterium]|nr:selenocysteine-specific translation elongation factor [Candidatus Fermentibacteraceae bacterium]